MRLSVLLLAVTASSIVVDDKNIATSFQQDPSNRATKNLNSGQFVIMGNCSIAPLYLSTYSLRVQRRDNLHQYCYIRLIATRQISLYLAENFCTKFFGHLFSVEDDEEYNFLLREFISKSIVFYMGYNHTTKEFYDGTNTTWLFKKIPRNGKGECVALLKSTEDGKYRLKLLPSPRTRFAILCKSNASITEDLDNRYVISEPCPEKPNKTYAYSWMVNVDKGKEKYCLFYAKPIKLWEENTTTSSKAVPAPLESVNFEDAERQCEVNFGGHLLSIANALEQTAVAKALNNRLKTDEVSEIKKVLLGLNRKKSKNVKFTNGVDGTYVINRGHHLPNEVYDCYKLVLWKNFS